LDATEKEAAAIFIAANTPAKTRIVQIAWWTVPAIAVPIVRQVIATAQHINLIRLVKRAVRRQARNIPILMTCRITMTRKIFTTTITMILMDMRMQKIIGTITMNRSK
jgi:tetrahydromethanopterin S-methyltransferase subunit C